MRKTYKILFGFLITVIILTLGIAFLDSELFQGNVSIQTTGKIKVNLQDEIGIIINGNVTAKKSTMVKKCDSAAGSCTLTGLTAGIWMVTAKTGSGSTSLPKNVTVNAGKTTDVNLTLVSPPTLNLNSDTKVLGVSIFKNLSNGNVRRVTGTCKDKNGILVNGTVIVYQGGTIIGQSKTVIGSYSIYDIAKGDYKFIFTTNGGKSKTHNVSIPSTGEITANFHF